MGDTAGSPSKPAAWIGLLGGPILGVLVFSLLPADIAAGGLSQAGRATAGVAALMAIWWLTEAIPLSATALLPVALFPLYGIASTSNAVSPYASPTIFLFLGGFILGLGMERWGLHRRIALTIVLIVGTSPRRLVAGFMLATAILSMWVSNTATAIMMLPIGMSIVAMVEGDGTKDQSLGPALLLGIAYAASIGGIGTIIGTPPNTVLANFVESELEGQLSMLSWMKIGIPVVAIMLPIAWAYLVFIAHPLKSTNTQSGATLVREQFKSLGKMSRGEWAVLLTFTCTALLWILRPQINDLGRDAAGAITIPSLATLSDTTIAMMGALALFLIPVNTRKHVFAMDWETASRVPWGILILFGGGLSLASAMTANGVDVFLGRQLGVLEGVHPIVLVLAISTVVIFLTELTSNTAVTNALLPVLAAVAVGLGIPPMTLLVPATIAASCAFMMPVATPPNAVVFGSGRLRIGQMIRAGFWLNLVGILVVTALTSLMPSLLSNG